MMTREQPFVVVIISAYYTKDKMTLYEFNKHVTINIIF